jgi:IS1 family transposase
LGPKLCRRTRQIVAFVIGDRSAKTCARLWAKIPSAYREKQRFSDFWKSYRPVFEEDPTHEQVGKRSGKLSHVERFFGLIRQRLSRYARETRAASQTERMLHLRTKLFVDRYNQAVTSHLPDTERMLISGAAMRTLLHICYGVSKNQTPFDASRHPGT